MVEKKTLAEMLEGKKLLIFDFDGTIADTSSFHEKAFLETFHHLSLNIEYGKIAGKKTIDAVQLICKGLNMTNMELKSLVLKKQSIYREIVHSNINPMPGVDKFLNWVHKSKKFNLAVASSGSKKNVMYCLSKLNYLFFFQHIVCGDDVKASKPDPEIFLKVFGKYNFLKSEVLIFEDSKSGFEASMAADIEYFDANQNLWESFKQ
jgi:HAD superfamily hydrolase (TIGR01509 family)